MSHRKPPVARTWAAGAFALWLSATASAQVGPEESARKMKPAEGLEATLFACEPMVVNPTNIDVDSRGRVWVAEGLNYRYTLHKNQPYLDDADKIKILEDTDGDGKADKVTVFADKIFPVPMGLAVEERWEGDTYKGCKVYVGNSPDLLVFEDTDGDDKADKKTVLLTGFGGYDHDHGVHGMTLGLDGRLYFTQGDNTNKPEAGRRAGQFDITDASGRRVFNDQLATTLRVHRDGSGFEILADRQRNNYETCLNSFGNVFTSDNDDDGNRGSRVIWVMEGGRYGYKTPGSPRHWGEDVPGNVPKLVGTGNGSPCGVMVYEGDLLPKEYRGAVLEAEAGPRVVFAFPLTRSGAAFRTTPKTLLASDDPWFRPVDVAAAPDGSLIVADWYDAAVGGHAFRDQTTGRIYRVAPKGATWKTPKPNFQGDGLAAALNSPNIATADVARRAYLDRPEAARDALIAAYHAAGASEAKARLLWVAAQLPKGDGLVVAALREADPRLREEVVRILGRDCRLNGQVTFEKDEAKQPAPAQAHLAALLKLADDPDAGVRRELILAIRTLPTSEIGAALKRLAASWDGRDRWYLEALNLALRDRESDYLAGVFDGTLFGELNLIDSGEKSRIALPPYFPIDRNEAFLSATDPELPPASALSKTLGLAWAIHRPEVLPILERVLPSLRSPELQQAADDILMQIADPAGAVMLADAASKMTDQARQRQMLVTLARKLEGPWKSAAKEPTVVRRIEAALTSPTLRPQGMALAAATGDPRYTETLLNLVGGDKAGAEERAAAVEAIARLKPPKAAELFDTLISRARERHATDPAADAAVRSLPHLGDAKSKLLGLMADEKLPEGLRRSALRTIVTLGDGGPTLLAMVRDKKLPDILKSEATTALYAHPDRGIRDQAMKLLPITSASGKPLPSIADLIRRDGDASRGREVFFGGGTSSCGACHRVQGQGQWVGPDLSTIGVKYGKDELLRSILSPSAAIGYNYVTNVVALKDGQVVTGLPVEETPAKLVLKTAEGRRLTIALSEIEERTTSDVSLMPEGLAQTLQEQQIVDLLAFLATLKQPVSVVGQLRAVGPLDPEVIDTTKLLEGPTHRRLVADAEGRFDLAAVAGLTDRQNAVLRIAATSPVEQSARLVFDTKANISAWLDGKALDLTTAPDGTRAASITLPKGTTNLVLRLPGGGDSGLVATFVADRPVEFGAAP